VNDGERQRGAPQLGDGDGLVEAVQGGGLVAFEDLVEVDDRLPARLGEGRNPAMFGG
jgi:hypothetical protein